MLRFIVLLFLALAATTVRAETPEEVQARIFNSFLRTAIEGDTNSQFVVGHRYEVGVGTAQDLDQALYWYTRAAERGHPLARMKIEERKRAQAPAPISDAAVSASPPPVARPVRPVPVVAKAPKAPKEAKEPRAPVERTVDALAVVLEGQWLQDRQAVEYLPSAKASCLRASDAEVVCFSQELSRVVNNATFTYTVKATLSDFAKDGRFKLNYLYHVADMDKNKNRGGSAGQPVGPREFLPKLGWQEPGHSLECRAADENTILCMKDKKQIQFTRK